MACLALTVSLIDTTPSAAQSADTGSRLDAVTHAAKLDPATPHSLGLRWHVAGDSNGNATVAVAFRRAGSEAWVEALPLLRVRPENQHPVRRRDGIVLFAGSLLELTPDTAYEIRLRLHDPDGGDREEHLTARTAAEPRLPADLRRRHVTPFSNERKGGGKGSQADPFNGLKAAERAARPGDLFLLAPGVYRSSLKIGRSGREGRPVVYRGPDDGGAILDGDGAEVLVDASDARHVWLRGLHLRNADTLILADRARHLVVQGNRFAVTRAGYVAKGAFGGESEGHAILDNIFESNTVWPRSKGIEHVFAVGLSGAGHVIAYNRMENLGDCVRGAWVDGGEALMWATDIHNNDMQSCTDDGIEADHGEANVRVFRNRITNSFAAISGQPIFGGPAYIYRNAIYNTLYSPIKMHNDTSGMLLFHNSSVRSGIPFYIRTSTERVTDSMTRNNLFIGTEGPALTSTAKMRRNDFDADGYGWVQGAFALWNGRTYNTAWDAREAGALYLRHGITALDPFRVFDGPLASPNPDKRHASRVNRPLLAPESKAVDAGVTIPGLNADFAGAAPDLGCCELGAALPHYGPRPPFAP